MAFQNARCSLAGHGWFAEEPTLTRLRLITPNLKLWLALLAAQAKLIPESKLVKMGRLLVFCGFSMHLLNPHQPCLKKLAACLLLSMLVFQLGACPCGCVEHNAWFQMLGLDADTHENLVTSHDEVTLQDPGHHDCDGQCRNEYVNNARQNHNGEQGSASSKARQLPALYGVAEQVLASSSSQKVCDSLALAHAPYRSLLQVYQL